MLHERVVHGLTVMPHGYPCSDEPPIQDPAAASVGSSSADPAVPRRAHQAADSQHAARPHPVPARLSTGALLRLHPPAAPHAAGHPERDAGQFGGGEGSGASWVGAATSTIFGCNKNMLMFVATNMFVTKRGGGAWGGYGGMGFIPR